MGLDMYLNAKRYLWTISEEDADSVTSSKIAELFPELTPRTRWGKTSSRVNEVGCEVAYWRKANAIHQWFVKNVQSGVDDCDGYAVEKESIAELIELCKQVLANKELAAQLLPSQSGFFFGSTEYDENYFQDLQSTIDQLEPWLAKEYDQWVLEYRSSW